MGTFLSKKLFVVILTGILDVLVASGQIDQATKELLLQLITSLGGAYVLVQGIIDSIKAKKND